MKFKILIFYLLFMQNIFIISHSEIIEKVKVEGEQLSENLISKSMIIIDEEKIAKFGMTEIADIFRFIPGVSVNRRGHSSVSYDLTMRGSNFEQILLLVNGVPVNNGQTGHFNTDLPFSLEDVKRVEVTRGGNPVSHGIGGFAGTINIVLKKRSGVSFNILSGERSLSRIGFGIGKKLKKVDLGISAARINSEGYYPGQEFDNFNLRTNISFSINNIILGMETGYIKKKFGAKDFYAPYPSIENNSSGSFQLNVRKNGKISFQLIYSHIFHRDNFILDRYNIPFFNSKSDTLQNYISLKSEYTFNDIVFSGGTDVEKKSVDSNAMGIHSQTRGGFFLSTGLRKSKWGADLGIRLDSGVKRNTFLTYYAGLYRKFSNYSILRINHGNSLRYPNFTELFYNSPANTGDPDLFVEKSSNTEISFLLPVKSVFIEFSAFMRKQNNMIDWIKEPHEKTWKVVNIDRNNIDGFELRGGCNFIHTSVFASLERLFSYGSDKNFISKYGFRFPDSTIKFNLNQKIKKNLGLIMNFSYKRVFETKEKVYLADIIINMKLKYFDISLHADNLLNSVIEEIPGVKIPGRWLWISINFKK